MALFLGPRYEAVLLLGLVAPLVLALWIGWSSLGRPVLEGPLRKGGLLALALVFVTWVGGLWVGTCEPDLGYCLLLLGPCFGLILAAVAMGRALEFLSEKKRDNRWLRLTVALSIPLAVMGVGLFELYRTPAVYAYSEFVGYFAGPLYDLVDYRLGTLLSYRVGSGFLLVSLLYLTPRRSVLGRGSRGRQGAAAFWFGLFLLFRWFGPSLGHRTTGESLRAELAAELESPRCVVRYAPNLTAKKSAATILDQCVVHAGEVAEFFGATSRQRITVWLFSSVEEKARLFGAGRTYVAKPWRGEIYIHETGYPHPTIRHELAHVILAEFGRGPFRVAANFFGLLPDPGRVEGFAVAAAPLENSDGTLEEWASAQLQLKRMPRLQQLFQFGFYGESAARAYNASGAFLLFLKERYGAALLGRWYQGESLEVLSGHSLEELEKSFHVWLEGVDVPAVVLRASEERFSAPAVVERRCPHAVDRWLGRAAALCGFDAKRAELALDRAFRFDPSQRDATLWLSSCYEREHDLESAVRVLEWTDASSWTLRGRSVRLGDLAWRDGDLDRARELFEEAQGKAGSVAETRALELRLWALEQPSSAPVVDLVRYVVGAGESTSESLARMAEYRGAHPDEFLGHYLLGRALLNQGLAGAALEPLRGAVEREPPLEIMAAEAWRSLLLAGCQQKSSSDVRQAVEHLAELDLPVSRRREVDALARRCLKGALP